MTIVISGLFEVIAADAEADLNMGTYFVQLSRPPLKHIPHPSRRQLHSLSRSHTTYHRLRIFGALLQGPATATGYRRWSRNVHAQKLES